MKKALKYAIIMTIVTSLSLSFISIGAAERPTYENIILDPEEPLRKSSIEFSVEIIGDDIDEVRIRVQECYIEESGDEACALNVLNESLITTDNVTWTGTATLLWDYSTIGHCWLEIKSNGTWYDYAPSQGYEDTDFDILPIENGGDNGDNGDNGGNGTDDSDGTPGFELALLVISMVLALSIYKKKRK
jgi:hypothetical protein